MTRRRTQAATAPIQAAGRIKMLTHPVTGTTKRMAEWADELGYSRKAFTSRITRWGCVPRAFEQATQIQGSRDEVAIRRQALYDIAKEQQPLIVRAVFYQAVVRGIVDKTQAGYKMVQTDLTLMRKSGEMPYEWIVDNTRSIVEPYAYNGVADALGQLSDSYSVNLWKDADCLVIMFLEKDGLSGVIENITLDCGVPLIPVRGYSSLSFLYKVAQRLRDETRPVYAYMLGDWDPSGVDAHRFIEDTMREMAPDVDFTFKRLGLTEAQIKKWKLPTRPTKQTDSRAAAWGDEPSVELDAVEPKKLRKLVKDAIDAHMDDDERARIRAEETADREYISELADEAR
jgi:hypothetical protein